MNGRLSRSALLARRFLNANCHGTVDAPICVSAAHLFLMFISAVPLHPELLTIRTILDRGVVETRFVTAP